MLATWNSRQAPDARSSTHASGGAVSLVRMFGSLSGSHNAQAHSWVRGRCARFGGSVNRCSSGSVARGLSFPGSVVAPPDVEGGAGGDDSQPSLALVAMGSLVGGGIGVVGLELAGPPRLHPFVAAGVGGPGLDPLVRGSNVRSNARVNLRLRT